MKTLKKISHPYLLLFFFCTLLISGKSFGGFYLLYILLALQHGGIHGWLALAGIILLLFTRERYHRQKTHVLEPVLNLIGAFLLLGSLAWFFLQDRTGYNNGTFEQGMPLLLLLLFGTCWILFIAWNLVPGKMNRKPPAINKALL